MRGLRTVAVWANPEKARARTELPRLQHWLSRRSLRVVPASQLSQADAVVVLGGDGTILAVAPEAAKHRVPVLGVNMGRLGFMTAIDVRGMIPALQRWLRGGWPVSERTMLEATAPPLKEPAYALNDAVLRIGATTRITTVDASVDGKDLARFVGDGVIVATTTGSTAYSLAAQGPVVHPDVDAIVLTPICPHSFMQRPLVIPSHHVVDLRIQERGAGDAVQLALDGQRVFALRSGERIRIRRSPHKLKLFQDPEASYFDVLREKLSWGGR